MVSGGSFEFVLWENNSKMGGLPSKEMKLRRDVRITRLESKID
jgi:hypothetical protein